MLWLDQLATQRYHFLREETLGETGWGKATQFWFRYVEFEMPGKHPGETLSGHEVLRLERDKSILSVPLSPSQNFSSFGVFLTVNF